MGRMRIMIDIGVQWHYDGMFFFHSISWEDDSSFTLFCKRLDLTNWFSPPCFLGM